MEKTIEAGKSQDQLADERLNDDELDKVAGGAGCVGKAIIPQINSQEISVKKIGCK